jgi:hypothetical protein
MYRERTRNRERGGREGRGREGGREKGGREGRDRVDKK